mmetsp:Transcript_36547/g.84712  ORF Transcript_36547/g.84712 Transcript_36547/m.84712 type:complete len:432 (+) Transcript_36547:523-1818(+)
MGKVFAFGSNADGQLGLPRATTTVARPVEIELGLGVVVQASCGYYSTTLLNARGEVVVIGGPEVVPAEPAPAPPPTAAVADDVVLVESPSQETRVVVKQSAIRRIPFGETTRIVNIVSGGTHQIAICSEGQVFTWGDGCHGELGHGEARDEEEPRRVEVLQGQRITAIAAGFWHSVAARPMESSAARRRRQDASSQGQTGEVFKEGWVLIARTQRRWCLIRGHFMYILARKNDTDTPKKIVPLEAADIQKIELIERVAVTLSTPEGTMELGTGSESELMEWVNAITQGKMAGHIDCGELDTAAPSHAQLRQRLTAGTVLRKHPTGRVGSSKARWVWVADDASEIYYMNLKGVGRPKSIKVASIRRVTTGASTPTLRRHGGDHGNSFDARCFSLICDFRTFDFEATSVKQSQNWVRMLRAMLEAVQGNSSPW